jgi:16S rRNA (adenine1518-N6/adenine1519-N6)-dimethyltransferase
MKMSDQVRPLKKLGQNFLINNSISEKIVEILEPEKKDNIIEIGAGKGALTKILLERDSNQLIAIEVDKRLIKDLNLLKKGNSEFRIIQNDFMDIPLPDLIAPGTKTKVIGNIPYNLTSSILFKLLDNFKLISRVVLMVQKEVANRIVARPGNKEYGILSVLTALHGAVRKEFDVKKENFYPVPKVDSAVISINFFSKLTGLYDYDLFKKIVKGCFQTRRKMLQNSLKRVVGENITGILKTQDLKKRPEELSVLDFISLSNEVYEIEKATQ